MVLVQYYCKLNESALKKTSAFNQCINVGEERLFDLYRKGKKNILMTYSEILSIYQFIDIFLKVT